MTARAAGPRRASAAATVLGFKLGWRAVRALPEPAAYALFNRVADAIALRGGSGVQRLRSNYAKVRPDLDAAQLDALVKAGLRSYMRYYCEAFRLPSLSAAQIDAAVVEHGLDAARARLAEGRSVVMFVGHLGNYDLAAAWAARHLGPVTTIAERLEPEEVFQEFVAYRSAINMSIIPLTGGPDPFAAVSQVARQPGKVIALAADRDLTRNGVEVDLLGRRVRVARGPALLHLHTGAALFPTRIHYEPAPRGEGLGGYRTVIEAGPELAPRSGRTTAEKAADLTQQCMDWLAPTIREHTSSWHMLQRTFVEDLDPARWSAGHLSDPEHPAGRPR